jgi:hypothetical protein
MGELAALAEFMREARALGEAAGVPVPPQLPKTPLRRSSRPYGKRAGYRRHAASRKR